MDVQLPPGVSRGASPNDRQGRWYDANLVRWKDGKLVPVGGWQRITKTPLTDMVRKLFAWRDSKDIKRFALGGDNSIKLYEGSSITDITPTDFVGIGSIVLADGYGVGPYNGEAYGTKRAVGSAAYLRAQVCSLDSWGEDLMALASSDGRLLHWSPSSNPAMSKMEVIAQAPKNNRAMVTTEQRHVMLIGAGGNPRRVAWSSSEDFTDWNFASVTNTAGFLELESNGLLVGAVEVRDGVLVLSDADAWLVSYVGVPYVYGRQRVGTATSLMSPNTITTVAGAAYWMGTSGFWMYEAGVCKPLPCDISDIFGNIDPVFGILYSHASLNGLFQEVTWYYPTKGSPVCNRYVTYNYAEGHWTCGTLGRTAMMEAGVHRFPVAAGADYHLYEHENGWTDAGLSRIGKVWAETSTMSAGNQTAIFRGQMDSGLSYDATQVRVLARQTHDGPEVSFGPYTPQATGFTPMRAGGRDLRVRFEAVADKEWSIGKVSFDIAPVGNR